MVPARLTMKAEPPVWLHSHAVLHLVYVLARRPLHRPDVASASGVEQLIGLARLVDAACSSEARISTMRARMDGLYQMGQVRNLADNYDNCSQSTGQWRDWMGNKSCGDSAVNNENLTDRQRQILNHLYTEAPVSVKNLIRHTFDGVLARENIEAVCHIINDEYLMKGIKEDYTPNAYGRELEALLDTINRVRLLQPYNVQKNPRDQ